MTDIAGRFLITGTGRSGTTWAANTLTANGVQCDHQQIRHEHVLAGEYEWPADKIGESSYEAVPLLPHLRPKVEQVVLLARHPVDVAHSWIQQGVFTDEWRNQDDLLQKVLAKHLPGIDAQPDPASRALWFWLEWNRLALQYADLVLLLNNTTPHRLLIAVGHRAVGAAANSMERNPGTYTDLALRPSLNAVDAELANAVTRSWTQLRKIATWTR